MKVLDIAFKDIQRAFRSAFGVVMMFIVPILIPGIIYAAFGGALSGETSGSSGFDFSVTRVVVVNLDRATDQAAGAILTEFLQSKDLASLLATTVVKDETVARERVNARQADVAVIIPADFTQAAFLGSGESNIVLYHDPTLTVGPLIVKQLLAQFADGFSGARITLNVAAQQLGTLDAATAQNIATQYTQWAQAQGQRQSSGQHPLFTVQAPPVKGATPGAANLMASMTVGMLVFFAFYTAAIMAQSILKEEEEGTLPRLFTTPTTRTTILGGKFIAIFLMVIVQVVVVMIISSLLFKIVWGDPLLVALSIVGLVICAAGFGLFLLSFVKTTRQAGPIIGGVLTATSMLGGLYSMTIPNAPAFMDTLSLFMPQGWVIRSWKLTLNGAVLVDVLLPVAVAVVVGAVLFSIGTLNFRKRYA
ncbi:Linearmycin resistance permease protein LnrN [Thermoflexales bacterium]|nr:Linearmycin resistance permease protein LnrN [Thermoflexales bacterium]